jgi:hypothetical protein
MRLFSLGGDRSPFLSFLSFLTGSEKLPVHERMSA